MIQATDLRLGNNIAKILTGGILTVDINLLKKVKRLPNFYKPIPLTPEILKKCGFVRNGCTSSNGSKLSIYHKEPMYPNGRIYFNSWCIMNKIPDYLHQLQNLYYALTGEELTVNL